MEWGTPVLWARFLLFCVPQSVKTKETNPNRPGSPTPCKQALRFSGDEKVKKSNSLTRQNNNFARASRFSVLFFAVTARLPRENA